LLQKDAGPTPSNTDAKNAALSAAFFALQQCFPRPLLTGNGISAGFSVLVRMDEASEQRYWRALQKFKRRTHA
jgi:hypothetical protein